MAGKAHRATPQFDRARSLLREQLADAVPPARDLKRIAKALGISLATLARARRAERVLTIGGHGPGSQPKWMRRTTPYRPRIATLPEDRFGIDCATYASTPDSAGVFRNPTRTYQLLRRSLAGQFRFRHDKNQEPKPSRNERRYRFDYGYTLSCFPIDLDPEDWDVASVRIQYGPADPDAAAFRVSFHSEMEHLLDLDRVDEILLRLEDALGPMLTPRRVHAFWQIVYLESTFDIPATDARFEDLLPLVHAEGIDESGTDVWPWQQYVQYGSPKSTRFAAMYEKTEHALAALRTECKARAGYLEKQCGIVRNSDLRRVGFSKLFHLRLPEPFESRRRASMDAYEAEIHSRATMQAASGTRLFVPRRAAIPSAPTRSDHPVSAKLIQTQGRRMINGRMERFAARPVLDQQERLTYVQQPAPTLMATLADIDVRRVDTGTVGNFRGLLTRHIRRLINAERATQGTMEYPAIVAMLDASVQARHALKRWRRSMPLAVAEHIRDEVQAYLSLVLLAQGGNGMAACAASPAHGPVPRQTADAA